MLGTMSHAKRAALVLLLYVVVTTLASWSILAMSARAQPAAGGEPAAGVEADGGSAATEAPGGPRTPAAGGGDGPLVVVARGDTAPFGGLLLRDERYAELKDAELLVNDAEFRARQAARAQADLEKVLSACLQVEEESFFGPSFWIGTAVGVVAAVAVGWLGFKILDDEGG